MSKSAVPPISVAVLSHRRPHLLGRVLQGVAQLDYPNFEVIVVGDEATLEPYGLPVWIAQQVRYVSYSEPNICRARNLAVEVAAGEIVAFIDDDAVPEPNWLKEIAKAFRFPQVGGVGGLVRAGDGLTVEWAGGVFDRAAVESPMKTVDNMRVFDAASQVAGDEFIGTMGANSAFRREAILSVGGFDESFRYYLDETDLMLRLAEAGWDAAVTRTAEVHHLREENAARDRLRTPRNLREIAASKAYFCKRHLPADRTPETLAEFREARRHELDPYIRLGLVRRTDCDKLTDQINAGIAEGLMRERVLPMIEGRASAPFARFFNVAQPEPLGIALVTGWGLGAARRTRKCAARFVDAGHRVSCFSFLSGPRSRTVEYVNGVWLHRGGTWRFDHRKDGRVMFERGARAEAEIERVSAHRRIDVVISPKAVGAGARQIHFPGQRKPMFATVARECPVQPDAVVAALAEILGTGDAAQPRTKPVPAPSRALDSARNA